MNKEHAEHNEKACDYLFQNKELNDWVVTTAFYSALHFVQHQIFPFDNGEREFQTFDEYYGSLNKFSREDKHSETVNLVRSQFYQASPFYRRLFDLCMSARYHRYQVSEAKAISARSALTSIKAFVTKP